MTALMAYCAATHGSVTSYGRTVQRNALVGGVAASAHLAWVAADVVYDNSGDDPQWRENVAARVGLIVIHEHDHDHIQPRAEP
jgi:hypothetical protein